MAGKHLSSDLLRRRYYEVACMWVLASGKRPNVSNVHAFLRSNGVVDLSRKVTEEYLLRFDSDIDKTISRFRAEDDAEQRALDERLSAMFGVAASDQ